MSLIEAEQAIVDYLAAEPGPVIWASPASPAAGWRRCDRAAARTPIRHGAGPQEAHICRLPTA